MNSKNEKLVAISWMQSHVIRAPLAKIMGLMPFIEDQKATEAERVEIINYLSIAANELDDVIKNITDVTSVVSLD